MKSIQEGEGFQAGTWIRWIALLELRKPAMRYADSVRGRLFHEAIATKKGRRTGTGVADINLFGRS